MARIDYYYSQELIKTGLETELGSGVTIELEPENIEAESCPYVAIYLTKREPSPDQPIAAGTIQRYNIIFEIWCYECNPDQKKAFKNRDDLMGDTEIALMNLRKDKVFPYSGIFNINGGEFESGLTETGLYIAGGSIILEFETQATI